MSEPIDVRADLTFAGAAGHIRGAGPKGRP